MHNLSVYNDSELIVKQVRNQCKTKHPRLRSYRNEIWVSIEYLFSAFNMTIIPRDQNMHTYSLAISASSFKVLDKMLVQYQTQVKYRPSINENIKHWKILDDEKQLKYFF